MSTSNINSKAPSQPTRPIQSCSLPIRQIMWPHFEVLRQMPKDFQVLLSLSRILMKWVPALILRLCSIVLLRACWLWSYRILLFPALHVAQSRPSTHTFKAENCQLRAPNVLPIWSHLRSGTSQVWWAWMLSRLSLKFRWESWCLHPFLAWSGSDFEWRMGRLVYGICYQFAFLRRPTNIPIRREHYQVECVKAKTKITSSKWKQTAALEISRDVDLGRQVQVRSGCHFHHRAALPVLLWAASSKSAFGLGKRIRGVKVVEVFDGTRHMRWVFQLNS